MEHASVIKNQRIYSLDSIRGIAALIVVCTHFWLFLKPSDFQMQWLFEWTPIQFIANGHFAVKLFFILSGFVLMLPYLRFRGGAVYRDFLIKRVCRIYFPFFVSIMVSIVLWSVFYDVRVSVPWDEGAKHIDIYDVLGHVFMFGFSDTIKLNPPMWTLIMEMRVALVFPLLVLFARYASWLSVPVWVVVSFFVSKVYFSCCEGQGLYVAQNAYGAFLLTVYYLQYFFAGIFIALKRGVLVALMRRIPLAFHFFCGFVILLMPLAFLMQSFTVWVVWELCAASYIILCCLSFDRFDRFLSAPPLILLGNVSYSLYLIHTPILFAVVYALLPYLSIEATILASVPFIVLGTYLFYRFVEVPSMHFGYALVEKIKSGKYVFKVWRWT